MEEKQRDGRGAEFDCVATSVCAASSSRGSLSESRGGHIHEMLLKALSELSSSYQYYTELS